MTKLSKNMAIALMTVLIAVCLTFSSTAAKFFRRDEYPLSLSVDREPINFYFPAGEIYTFNAPHDGYYAFQLWGGNGGDSQNFWASGGESYELGGAGGAVSATIYLSQDDVLLVTVGTMGGTTAGGYNGGGDGGSDLAPINNDYYGGGGATDIRIVPGALSNRILVAGGGGGGSGGSLNFWGTNYPPSGGGDGGTENFDGSDGFGEGFGNGATQDSGGAGYQDGDIGRGGSGQYSGGGGGGGYYGGGGSYGSGGGGGGGSSYISSSFYKGIPIELPDRAAIGASPKDGYAIISFLGRKEPDLSENHQHLSEKAYTEEENGTESPEILATGTDSDYIYTWLN